MSGSQRVKGRRAEAEVAAILREHGFTIRGLESGGDHLAVRGELRLHVEVKRQERGWRWAWAAQAVADAPEGSLPVVVFRRSREPWQIARRAGVPWIAARVGMRSYGSWYSTEPTTGRDWAFSTLDSFLGALV